MIHILILYSTPGLADIVRAIWSVKAKMTPAESVFSLRRHATPGHHWRCLFWLSSSESKRPRGTKPKAYPLCMGNNEKAPFKCSVGGGGQAGLWRPGSAPGKSHWYVVRICTEMQKNHLLFGRPYPFVALGEIIISIISLIPSSARQEYACPLPSPSLSTLHPPHLLPITKKKEKSEIM